MNLVGMVDVIFLLVIFWMVVTSVAGPFIDGAVRPPQSALAREAPPPAATVVHLAAGASAPRVAGRPAPLDALGATLARGPAGPVVVRADADADAALTARVLEAAAGSGRAVRLAVRRVEAQP